MTIWLCLRWWYGAGWSWAWQRLMIQRIDWCLNNYSMPLLVRTWFAPFKQTFSGTTNGPLGAKFQAWVDRQISRVIGFLVRTIILIVGLLAIVFVIIVGLVSLILWPFVPFAFIISLVLMGMGIGQ